MKTGVTLAGLLVVLGLSGCMQSLPQLDNSTFLSTRETKEVSRADGSFTQDAEAPQSEVISDLLARRSLLENPSAYSTVAAAALASSSRAAEAELRSARLRADAENKNWLPTLGPNVSLTSLSDLVAGILIEQVLFDNGRRKAERAFAAADVEVAATNLSIDMNERVYTALSLYTSAAQADEQAALAGTALTRMQGFERIVVGRVKGGVGDQSDQRVVEGKVNDMRWAVQTAKEAAATSRAELSAMTGQSFAATGEPLVMAPPLRDAENLSILLAQSEADRSIARATAERAGLLPTLTASASVTNNNTIGALGAKLDQPLGLGTGSQIKAIEASKDIAHRQIDEARENARRDQSRLRQNLVSYRRQEVEARKLAKASRETFRLFERQFQAGQRSVMDVVNVYEQLIEREKAYVRAKYQTYLTEFELARDLGALADGDKI
ncbi:outer membrane protein, adhesin transport system [Shimia gijangensis]|uniref:Outer membrane protein, adhesin transport system n=1 Tax=Shimia gijangensis TaxID=1470563 RepID=A0A1M6LW02_9RHOB|nr:TolC family protein [Shimia gijangensis]SHJ75352.1 outer membrane protein, adhesin transport system [Shimia gijangensis]